MILNRTAVFLILSSMISISPLILNFAPIKPNELSLLALLIIFVIKIRSSFKFHKLALISILFLFFLGLTHSLYWHEFTFRLPIYFYSIFFILFSFSKNDLLEYTNYLSVILILMLIFSVAGFVYAFLGYPPIFTIFNEDSRPNNFYLSTFSSTYSSGFIRPSGFFDEPGALSFFICMTVALRESLSLKRRTSWIILILGLVTTSMMHFIFMIIFLIKTQSSNLTLKIFFIGILKIMVVICIFSLIEIPFISPIMNAFISKFQIVEGGLAGDNRSILFLNALEYLDLKVFFFGLDIDCMLNSDSCSLKGYMQYGENPLSLLVHWGILLALPYFIILIYLIIRFIASKDLVILGAFLLLLQRPYVMSYGYAVIILIYAYSLWQSKKQHILL